MTDEQSSAASRMQNDMDPLSKGEPDLIGDASPESQDGGRVDASPSSGLADSLADGESLAEPGAGSVEGTAS